MEREEAFEFLGINKFHEAGYTGSRVKIMSDEKILKEYRGVDKERWDKVICPKGYQKKGGSWHGSSVMQIMLDICPDATFIAFPMDMKGSGDNYSSKCIDYILENKVHLFTTSSTGGKCSKAKEKAMQDCIDNGCIFFASAGNQNKKGILSESKSDKYITIGALTDKNGKLEKASYSSIGKELDYVELEIYGIGTSFTDPTFCSRCALLQDFFIAKTGRALVRSELIDFVNDHLLDVEDEGFDIKTGHGLFILPDPGTINISKYVPEYSGNVDYTGFPEIKEEKKMYKVFLGVGHGGNDSGAVANGLREADINLNIALACQEVLIKHGIEVLLSRYTDENDPVSEGIIECNNYNPDIAIDIHTNAGGGDGFEVFTHSGGSNSRRLAEFIETETKELNNSRGIKTKLNDAGKEYYAFIRDTNPPAIIVECAFVDNKEDVKCIDTVEEQRAFGIAYAKGILKYFGIEYKQVVKECDKLVLKINQKWYTINGVKKELEVAPRIENGRTLVTVAPLRELGLTVEWNGETQEVTITKGGK